MSRKFHIDLHKFGVCERRGSLKPVVFGGTIDPRSSTEGSLAEAFGMLKIADRTFSDFIDHAKEYYI